MSRADDLRRWLAPPLLAFVLISVGFAWGRLSAPSISDGDSSAMAVANLGPRVVVRYFHGAIRCVTCNAIEARVRAVLDEHYRDRLDAGSMVLEAIDFDQDDRLARRYGVAASVPVIISEVDGRELTVERLDAVWEASDDAALDRMLVTAIDAALQEAGLAPGTGSPQ